MTAKDYLNLNMDKQFADLQKVNQLFEEKEAELRQVAA